MRRTGRRFLSVAVAVAAGFGLAASVRAQGPDELAPYKMIRSLQFVQDTVVLGDHSAMEMQRFLLSTIDSRLRSANASVFEDPRNVDAALVYAMSGGNPETLDMLVQKDIAGNFDGRVTDAIRSYLGGRGATTTRSLAEIFPEYRHSRIGPYLALVSANSVIRRDPALALSYFDWARLDAPGTIIEEAALRRSIYVAVENGWVERGVGYSSRYARRFLRSPYASQFADLFVKLAVDHFDRMKEEDILEILSFMDVPRQREVYLRMARLAAISGKNRLAALSAEKAQALAGEGETVPKALADLYSGLAAVPSADVGEAMDRIMSIPDEKLSAKDRALKAAARTVAEEVMREPVAAPADIAAVPAEAPGIVTLTEEDLEDQRMNPRAAPPVQAAAAEEGKMGEESGGTGVDPAFDSFVATGRSKLDEIDSLLKGEGS
ncbi:MAG: chemotaxis protein MotC [Shinella sp.]|nr:chemotaxis protein MotC [Shinella sp.]